MNEKSRIDWYSMTDKSLLEQMGKFIQAQRLKQNRTQDEVAKDAGISRSTLSLLERGEVIRLDSLIQVLRILNLLHIMDVFREEEIISPIKYAKMVKKRRKQASPRKANKTEIEDIGW